MLKKSDIDDFRDHVKTLGLKFPVAAIAKATKVSKGNVSDFLKGRKDPSENFLVKFYDQFPKNTQNVPQNTVSTGNNSEEKDKSLLELLMQQMANLMQTQNNLLRDQKTSLVDKQNKLLEDQVSLTQTVKTNQALLLTIQSGLVRALAGIDKKSPEIVADELRRDLQVHLKTIGIL